MNGKGNTPERFTLKSKKKCFRYFDITPKRDIRET